VADKTIYTVGGTVQAGGGIYLPRPADDELLQQCKAGEFSYVLTARQMGKSSLMVRTSERLKADGRRAAIIDLTRLGTALRPEQWYLGLVDELVEQLQLEVDYQAWWKSHAHLGPAQRLSRFLREVILDIDEAPLVIFIDEIDVTLSLPFADEFFAAIRACYNARGADPAFRRLSFVLLGVATPSDLIRDPQRTPFNIGYRIDLTDFTLEQSLPLADGLGLPPDQARQTLGWVLDWTGGHPYLTQRLCRALVGRRRTTWDANTVAKVVEETFFGEHSKQDGNLQFVRDMLTRRAPDVRKVLQIYQQVRAGQSVRSEEQSLDIAHLKISGVVEAQDGLLKVRNPIYEHVFDQEWVDQSLPLPVSPRLQRLFWAGSLGVLLLASSLTFAYFFRGEAAVAGHWVTIPAGSFVMGMNESEAQLAYSLCIEGALDKNDCDPINTLLAGSGPQVVTVLPEFAMLDNEVTHAQYQQCVDAQACVPPTDWFYDRSEMNDPATLLNLSEAEAYCAWLGGRLPTQAEWEKAARGPHNLVFPWGNVWDPAKANLQHAGDGTVQSILQYAASDRSGYGIKNLAGNVREWTRSEYSPLSVNQPFSGNTVLENSRVGLPVIVRGGFWGNVASVGMSSSRGADSSLSQRESLGFRCVCSDLLNCRSPWTWWWTWFDKRR
jgi:formylglycine-generating enzyme required for sulfatase activity